MDSLSLTEIQKTRFLALNFSRLQGLRGVPLGLGLFLVSVWANSPRHTTWDFLLLGLMALVCGGLYILINNYYRKTYGLVVASPENRRTDRVISIVGGLVALAAFWLDINLRLTVSLVGLVFTAAILGEYFLIARYAHQWYPPITPLFAVFIAIVSVLPALGVGDWWRQIAVKTQMLGVCMVVGGLLTIAGMITHLYFTHSLPLEPRHDRSI